MPACQVDVFVTTSNFVARAPTFTMLRIDVHQDDKGLAACWAGANLKADWTAAYTKVHQVLTLDDFVHG